MTNWIKSIDEPPEDGEYVAAVYIVGNEPRLRDVIYNSDRDGWPIEKFGCVYSRNFAIWAKMPGDDMYD